MAAANATAQFITHVTTAGERWDTLAWKYYANPFLIQPIIMTNPTIPIMAVFPAGLSIGIPVLLVSDVNSADLPPWSQAG